MTSPRLAIWILLLALGGSSAARGESHKTGGVRGDTGYLAVRGDVVLAARSAERLFTPASVQKLLVSATALHHLGADFRVVTELRAAAAPTAGIVDGDLVVGAAGDPTWSARFFPDDPRIPLRRLAERLREAGVRRVKGDLVVDLSRFPGRRAPSSRAVGEVAYGWAAPTSALAVDDNLLTVHIAPGARVGDAGRAELAPLDRVATPWSVENRIRTAPRERHERGTVDFLPRWGERHLVVEGEYPISEPGYRVEASIPAPELRAAEVLGAVLAEAAIAIDGTIRLAVERPAADVVLARLASPPLRDWLPEILGESHNWTTEMLARVLAAETGGEGRLDAALDLVEEFLVEVVGAEPDGFALDDASGVSPYDLLAPETVVRLLRWAWRRPWRDTFVRSLARPGAGTLESWRDLPPIRAKTGTGRRNLALAGYLTRPEAPGDEPIVFAILLDRRVDERPAQRAEIVAWIAGLAKTPSK